MGWRGIVFDLDGTLLDTLDDLRDAVNAGLTAQGLPTRSRDEVRAFVGKGVARLIHRALPEGRGEEEPLFTRTLERFRAHYSAHMEEHTAPYPGIEALLARLAEAGCPMAIVTNKYEAAARQLCARRFPQVAVVVGERPELARKPAPDGVWAAMREMGLEPAAGQAVYIGDSETDVQTAKAAGLSMIGVTWGFRTRETLEREGANFIVEDCEALWDLLRKGLAAEAARQDFF